MKQIENTFKDEFDFSQSLDMAILDIQMPKVSGVEVLKMVKEKPAYQQLPVLAMTANVFVEEQEKLFVSGFKDLLLKPFSEQEVMGKVSQLMVLGPIFNGHQKENNHMASGTGDPSATYDLADIERFCMGDQEMLQEVMLDIINLTQKDIEELSKILASKEMSRIREIVHQLSSRLKQIKVPAGDQAKKIEVDIKNNKLETVTDDVLTLIKNIQVILQVLRKDFTDGVYPQA